MLGNQGNGGQMGNHFINLSMAKLTVLCSRIYGEEGIYFYDMFFCEQGCKYN